MPRQLVLAAVLLSLLVQGFIPSLPAASAEEPGPRLPPDPGLDQAVAYLRDQQDAEGCIKGSWITPWAVMSVRAAGHDPAAGAPSLVDGLRACTPEGSLHEATTTEVARFVLAIVAAGEDPRSFDGENWVQRLRDRFAGVQFLEPGQPRAINDDAFAVMALRASGVPASDPAIGASADHLLASQNDDGGWGWTDHGTSSPDMTAAILEALAAARVLTEQPDTRSQALGYLSRWAGASPQDCVGDPHLGPNPDTTSWVVLGLLAAGQDPRAGPWTQGPGPWACLEHHQRADGGFSCGGCDRSDAYATTQALLGLAAVPHAAIRASLVRPDATLTTTHQPEVGRSVNLVAEGVAAAGWRTPAGEVLTGSRASWTPEQAGTVRFDVLLMDADGLAGTGSFEATVSPASSPGSSRTSGDDPGARAPERPTASSQVPPTAERNVSTTVNVTATPGDARVVAFQVDWGEGATSPWSATGQLEHTYDELGEQTVRARARDANGYTSTWTSATLHVVDARPRLTLDGPEQVLRHTPFQVTATAQDPDGPAPNVTWYAEGHKLAGSNVSLELSGPGAHLLHAVAEDRAGNQATASLTVTAVNRAPVLGSVGPQVARANATHILTAEATDPDGDRLRFTWTHGNASATGGQFHLPTGAPGLVNLTVNGSDPHGAWTLANLTVRVAEQPAKAAPPPSATVVARNETTRAVQATPPAPGTPRAHLPALVQGRPGTATLIEGRASQENGTVRQVEVALGEPVPVRGTASFQALVPALPNGTYELAARAMGEAGTWGPWTNATLVVAGQEPLTRANTSPIDEPAREMPLPWLAAPLALAALALARPPDRMSGRPRRPAGGHRGTRGAGAEGTGKEREAGMAGGHVDAARRRRWSRARPAALRAVRARQGSCKSWWPAPGGVTAELDNAVSPSPRKGAALPSPRLLAVPSLSSHAAPADSVRRFKRWRWP